MLGRLFGGDRRGRIVIKFLADNEQASIAVTGHFLPEEWHWLYLLHLSKTLYTMGDEGNAPMLLSQMKAYAHAMMAEGSSAYSGGKRAPSPIEGEVKIVPERADGVPFVIEVLGKPGRTPFIQTSLPEGGTTGQLALSNLVLLHHILSVAEESSDHFLLAVYIASLVKFYEEQGSYGDASSVTKGPMFAMTLASEIYKTATQGGEDGGGHS